ncbi:hypothetical protein V1477_006622, partial [Vespula maculifrons]
VKRGREGFLSLKRERISDSSVVTVGWKTTVVETVVNVVVGKGAYIMSVFIFPVLPPPSFPYLSSLYPQSPFVRTLSTVNAAKLTPGGASLRTASKHALGDEEEIRETLEWASTEGGYGGGEADDGGGDRADDGDSGSGSSGDERERDTFPLD